MSREAHVRFCEGVGVKFPRATHLVILCGPGQGEALHERLDRWLTRKGLVLNKKKTRVVNFREEGFSFLSFDLSWRIGPRSGKRYVHVEPSEKARQSLREAIRGELNHWTTWRSVSEAVRQVNRIQRGWSGYFHYRNSSRVFGKMRGWVGDRMRRWLWRKHACRRSLWNDYRDERLRDFYGLWTLPGKAGRTRATAKP